MQFSLWSWLERVGALLEPTDRHVALGDIQERGADARALLDLIGLVALRQLQACKSWRTWLLAAIFILPAFAVFNSAHAIADTASFYPWPDLSQISRPDFALMIFNSAIATLALSWTTGFAVGLAGRYRVAGILLPSIAVFLWLSNAAPFRIWHRTSATLMLLSFTLLAAIPSAMGLARAWRGTPLSPRAAIVLAILIIPFAFMLPNSPLWSTRLLTVAAFWPAYYAIGAPMLSQRSVSRV